MSRYCLRLFSGWQTKLNALCCRRCSVSRVKKSVGHSLYGLARWTSSTNRTRLTAGVVTGKLDVREAAVKLPSVDRLAADKYLDDILDADDGLEFDHGEDVAELGE